MFLYFNFLNSKLVIFKIIRNQKKEKLDEKLYFPKLYKIRNYIRKITILITRKERFIKVSKNLSIYIYIYIYRSENNFV